MVAHGLITGMLFFLAGSVKHRYHTLEISRLSGMLIQMPRLGWILGLCAMASLGLPGLAGFWGEFPAILVRLQPELRPRRGAVPHADGDRRRRHRVRRRLPAVAVPAHRVRHADGRSSQPAVMTTPRPCRALAQRRGQRRPRRRRRRPRARRHPRRQRHRVDRVDAVRSIAIVRVRRPTRTSCSRSSIRRSRNSSTTWGPCAPGSSARLGSLLAQASDWQAPDDRLARDRARAGADRRHQHRARPRPAGSTPARSG